MMFKNIIKKFIPKVGRGNECDREVWLERERASIPKNIRILDAGAGTQRYKKFCKHLDYVSQDFGQYDGEGDSSGLQMGDFDYMDLDIVSDITSIPEPDGAFDAIMCIEVLEHLPNPVQAVGEFSRLLKPGGRLIITAPFCSLTHFAPFHFSSGFNKYWYEEHLSNAGFNLLKLERNGNFFEYLAQEVNRILFASEKYAKDKPNVFELFCMFVFLRMLQRFSLKDQGSSELLCFGYHVVAKKKS